MENVYKKASLFFLVCVLAASTSFAANRVWTNGGGDNLWSNPDNWTTSNVPSGSDNAVFNSTSTANCIIDIPASFRNLDVDPGYTGSITQNSGAVITMNNFNLFDGEFYHSSAPMSINSFTVNSATYYHGAGAVTIGGALTVENGGMFVTGAGDVTCATLVITDVGTVFQAPGGNLVIQGDIDWLGGSFAHGNGTITIASFSNMFIDLNVKGEFYNVVLMNNDTRDIALTVGDTLIVKNRLSLVDGDLKAGGAWIVEGDLEVKANFDDGGAPILMSGPNNVSWIAESYLNNTTVIIDKAVSTATVTITKGTAAESYVGDNGSIVVNNGTLVFASNVKANVELGNSLLTGLTVNSGGTVNWPVNDTVVFNGSINLNGGSILNSGSSTVILNIGANTEFNFSGGMAHFDNLVFNARSNAMNFNSQAGDTWVVHGDLALVEGQLEDVYLDLKGNVIMYAALDQTVTSSLKFSGSNYQFINASQDSTIWDGAVIIEQPVPSLVILLSPFSLDNPTSTNTITLNSGKLVSSNTNMFTLAGDFKLMNGGNDSSFVTGPMRRTGRHSALTPFIFKIGQMIFYRPMSLENTITDPATHFRAEYYHINPHDVGLDTGAKSGGINHVSSVEWWALAQVGGTAQRVGLSWGYTSGVRDLPSLRVARWNGTSWTNEGQFATTGDSFRGTVNTAGFLGTFGAFTLATTLDVILNPLPVDFLSVKARRQINGTGLVEWKVASETDCSHYDVERSFDGVNYKAVSTVTAAGNSQQILNYSIIDSRLGENASGYTYYRIKQTDFNGAFSFSPVAVIFPVNTRAENAVEMYPNPANDKLIVRMNEEVAEDATVRVLNSKWEIVISNASPNSIIDMSYLPAGMYVVEVQGPLGKWHRKIMHN